MSQQFYLIKSCLVEGNGEDGGEYLSEEQSLFSAEAADLKMLDNDNRLKTRFKNDK